MLTEIVNEYERTAVVPVMVYTIVEELAKVVAGNNASRNDIEQTHGGIYKRKRWERKEKVWINRGDSGRPF